ncbi:PD-(D/E)XK nuclease superfamily protein [Bryocella elongata]|uniref:PD-(D/E)XK nuclease superfamily protein n=1 Tax=Bryocella elongata TaxID=863522 RepID=A0A1H6AF43_9BACT|nr:PD-(D/E)XK nuclease family protein [Bryocella elongata]SEG46794.1 PD-(D/E)XK nuclease superfamily protein [Bryocella elongata]
MSPAREWSNARMSPSKIGVLSNPNACLRCFWTLLRAKFKKPFSFPMPGIMFTLDAQEKALVKAFVSRGERLPKYFGAFRDVVEIIPMRTVSGRHEETGLDLYGLPDLVLRLQSGEVLVIDNKTAQPKDPDHPLYGMYVAQLNFYAMVIAMMDPENAPTRLALLNYAISGLDDEELYEMTSSDSMLARFKPVIQELTCNPAEIVEPLLRKVRKLIDATEPPAGAEGCKDCAILASFSDCLSVNDSARGSWMTSQEQTQWLRLHDHRRLSAIDSVRQAQLDTVTAVAQAERPYGVLAAWAESE